MTHLDLVTRTVLALAFPRQWRRPPLAEAADPIAVLKALKANKIPLLSLSAEGLALAPSLRDSEAFQRALEQARNAFDHYRREYKEISTALKEAGLPHLLMKSAGPFPYESDNFDILIPHDRRDLAERALRPLGFVPQRHYRESWKFIHKRFAGGGLQSIAHFHEEVSWGVEPFLDCDGLWRRAQPSPFDPGFLVPAPEDSFLVTMAHGVYENDRIKLGDLLKVHVALQRAGGELDWALMEAVATSRGWAAGYRWILAALLHLERSLWGASFLDPPVAEGRVRIPGTDRHVRHLLAARRFPAPLGLWFSKTLFLRKIYRANRPAELPGKLLGFLRDNLEALWPLPLHRSMLLAVSGMDGAGKSTVIEELRRLCEDLELKHEVIWLRAGNSDLMQVLNRLLRRMLGGLLRRATNDEALQDAPGAGIRAERRIEHPVVARLWYWLAMGELLLRARLLIRLGRLGRRVVICDRYLADSLVDLVIRCGRAESIAELGRRAPACWFPKPDLAIVLLADARAAHARKEQEFTLEQLALRARLYQEVATGGVVVDSTLGKAATIECVKRLFLDRYAPPAARDERT